jgi:hypothetical protein
MKPVMLKAVPALQAARFGYDPCHDQPGIRAQGTGRKRFERELHRLVNDLAHLPDDEPYLGDTLSTCLTR